MLESLFDEVLVIICSHLDNLSKWSLMQVSRRFEEIFASNSKLLKDFHLEVDSSTLQTCPYFPRVPIKNIIIFHMCLEADNEHMLENLQLNPSSTKDEDSSSDSYDSNNSDDSDGSDASSNSSISIPDEIVPLSSFLSMIDKYKNSITTLKLVNVKFHNENNFYKMLKLLLNLDTIEIQFCELLNFYGNISEEFPQIKKATSLRSNNFFLDAFQTFNALEKIKIINTKWIWGEGFSHRRLNNLLVKVPTLQHLELLGIGTASYFEHSSYPFKIRKIDAYLTTFDWNTKAPRLKFYESQKGSLKEFHIDKLPYDYDGGDIMRYLINEMELEKLTFGECKLIENGEKCLVDEIWFTEVQITAGFELMRQFPSIKKLRLWLCQTTILERRARQLLEPPRSLFYSLDELTLLDHSGNVELLDCFLGLYKNCRNISLLDIETINENLNDVLREILPLMTQLKKLRITFETPLDRAVVSDEKKIEMFEIIRLYCIELKTLCLDENFLNSAREFFHDDKSIEKY